MLSKEVCLSLAASSGCLCSGWSSLTLLTSSLVTSHAYHCPETQQEPTQRRLDLATSVQVTQSKATNQHQLDMTTSVQRHVQASYSAAAGNRTNKPTPSQLVNKQVNKTKNRYQLDTTTNVQLINPTIQFHLPLNWNDTVYAVSWIWRWICTDSTSNISILSVSHSYVFDIVWVTKSMPSRHDHIVEFSSLTTNVARAGELLGSSRAPSSAAASRDSRVP